MSDKQPKDFLDRAIGIGQEVVYPTRRGSSMWLCRGTVKDVKYHDDLSAEPWTLTIEVEAYQDSGRKLVKRLALGVPARRCVLVV